MNLYDYAFKRSNNKLKFSPKSNLQVLLNMEIQDPDFRYDTIEQAILKRVAFINEHYHEDEHRVECLNLSTELMLIFRELED